MPLWRTTTEAPAHPDLSGDVRSIRVDWSVASMLDQFLQAIRLMTSPESASTASQQGFGEIVPGELEKLEVVYQATREPNRKLTLLETLWEKRARAAAVEDGARLAARNEPDGEQLVQLRLKVLLSELRVGAADIRKRQNIREADVADFDNYLSLKSKIERELGVIVTDQAGSDGKAETRADGSQIRWTSDELAVLSAALQMVPSHLYKYNRGLAGLIRTEKNPSKSEANADYGIYLPDHFGFVRRFDSSSEDKLAGDLHHEVGHRIHMDPMYAELFKQFIAAAGWDPDVSDERLRSAGFSDSDIEELRRPLVKGIPFWDQLGTKIGKKDGIFYQKDRDKDGTVIACRIGYPRTFYGYSHYQEHFADDIRDAIGDPEGLAQWLIDLPARSLELVREDNSAGARPDRLQNALQHQIDKRKICEIYRTVLGATAETQDAIGRLQARNVDAAKIAAFTSQAERRFTQAQIIALEREIT